MAQSTRGRRRARRHPSVTLHSPAFLAIARRGQPPDLSRDARRRLAMLDWHRANGGNVSRTARHFGYSRPTVYRTLSELVDAGLLRIMTLAGRAIYEHDYGYPQHDHLYCTKCRKLIEFTSSDILQIRESVAKLHRFRARDHRFIIEGTCDECAKLRSKGRRQDRV